MQQVAARLDPLTLRHQVEWLEREPAERQPA
jgi:hypothetical protein